ncbi:MAG: hypothetical protein ABI193_12390, partial [Minicystis sp.]
DKLETCAAAHRMAVVEKGRVDAERDTCAAARDKERNDFKQILDEVERSGSSSEAERARQAQAASSRLKACEDANATAQKLCSSEESRLSAQIEQAQIELTAIRAEHTRDLAAIEAEKKHFAATEQERDQCRAEKLECSVDRDALKVLARNMLSTVGRLPGSATPTNAPGSLDPKPLALDPAPSGAPAATAVHAPSPPLPAPLPPIAPAAPPPAAPAPLPATGS